MDLLQLLIVLMIVGICGALAELVTGFSTGGPVISVIVGVVGAYLGMGFARLLPFGLPLALEVGSLTVDLIWTFLGSLLVVVLLELSKPLFKSRTTQRSA